MNRRFVIAGLIVVVLSGVLRAETDAQVIDRMQRSMNTASELGNFSRVQALRLQLAEFCARSGDYALAARQYELLLASRPPKVERVRYFVQLGRMRDALEDYGAAIAAFQDALHDDPKSWDASLNLARAYTQIELYAPAIATYQKCIVLKPANHESYQEIADLYAKLGYFGKALTHYKKAMELAPNPGVYLGMADCYVQQGDIENATGILQQGKSQLPRVDYDVRLGDIYLRQQDAARAQAAWEEALRSDPTRDDVRLKLITIYDSLKHPAQADRMLKDLLARYPESPLVHFLKAWVLFDRGDRSGSRREAQKVADLKPTELVRHYNDQLLRMIER